MGKKGLEVFSSYFSFFWWDFEGEYYNHSRALREDNQEEYPLRTITADGSEEDGNGCWDLVEVYSDDNKIRGPG